MQSTGYHRLRAFLAPRDPRTVNGKRVYYKRYSYTLRAFIKGWWGVRNNASTRVYFPTCLVESCRRYRLYVMLMFYYRRFFVSGRQLSTHVYSRIESSVRESGGARVLWPLNFISIDI